MPDALITAPAGPFSLSPDGAATPYPRWLCSAVEHLSCLTTLNRIYHTLQHHTEPLAFIRAVLHHFNIRVRVSGAEHIPRQGSVVLVANHPFGGLEGMLLAHLLLPIRPDAKILANFLLQRIPQLRDLFIFVDPFRNAQSARANIEGLRAAVRWLQGGGVLGIFPAGEVAHLNVKLCRVVEPLWSESMARLIRRSGASVVPVAFFGRNGNLFHLAGVLHPLLRTALLPRELLNKRNRTINVCIGAAIPPPQLQHFTSDRALIDYLRQHTLNLVC